MHACVRAWPEQLVSERRSSLLPQAAEAASRAEEAAEAAQRAAQALEVRCSSRGFSRRSLLSLSSSQSLTIRHMSPSRLASLRAAPPAYPYGYRSLPPPPQDERRRSSGMAQTMLESERGHDETAQALRQEVEAERLRGLQAVEETQREWQDRMARPQATKATHVLFCPPLHDAGPHCRTGEARNRS